MVGVISVVWLGSSVIYFIPDRRRYSDPWFCKVHEFKPSNVFVM